MRHSGRITGFTTGVKCGDQRTRNVPAVARALLEQLRERPFDSAQILQPHTNIDQMPGRQLLGRAALHAVVEPQELRDFVQAEPQPLC